MTKSGITNADLMVKTQNEISSVALVVIGGLGGGRYSFAFRHLVFVMDFGPTSHRSKATGLNKAKFRVQLSAVCEVGKPLFRSV